MQDHDKGQIGFLALCLLGAGLALTYGLLHVKEEPRYVTVKGFAEREANADLAIWPITFHVASNDLGDLQSQIDKGRTTIFAFLTEGGFDKAEIGDSAPRISDAEAGDTCGNNGIKPPYRYSAEATITVRSTKVAAIKHGMEQAGALVGRGIVLSAHNWESHAEFLFTKLDTIKGAMIEEATKDGRRAAENFARDSSSRVGKIRRATQGYFEINDRDQNTPDIKRVRVVTTLDYYLVD